jgi:hypothetical protein
MVSIYERAPGSSRASPRFGFRFVAPPPIFAYLFLDIRRLNGHSDLLPRASTFPMLWNIPDNGLATICLVDARNKLALYGCCVRFGALPEFDFNPQIFRTKL